MEYRGRPEAQELSSEGEPGGIGGKESACIGWRPAACQPTQSGRLVKGRDWE